MSVIIDNETIYDLPKKVIDRTENTKYIYKNKIIIWKDNHIKCKHDRRHNTCTICKKNSNLCMHNIDITNCKDCVESLKEKNEIKQKIQNEKILVLPKRIIDRKKNTKYYFKGKVVIWSGKVLKCEHNRVKSVCKECKGSQICEHNKLKSICKECKGSQICEHNQIKTQCKECKGSQICEHNRQKCRCRECNGASFCEHNRRRIECKECKGSQICEHNHKRSRCKECEGTELCEHNRRRSSCRECKGSEICEHSRQKSQCRECKGTSICEHGKRKDQCKLCSPESKYFCKLCKTNALSVKKYDGYCFSCYCKKHPDEPIPRRFMLKENFIHNFLRECFPDIEIIHNKKIHCGKSGRRPDWIINLHHYYIIIECDEDGHYNVSCENKRITELYIDGKYVPIVFIRFNPDMFENQNCFEFDSKNKIQTTSTWEKRKITLKSTIQKHLDFSPKKAITIEYLYYTQKQIENSTKLT